MKFRVMRWLNEVLMVNSTVVSVSSPVIESVHRPRPIHHCGTSAKLLAYLRLVDIPPRPSTLATSPVCPLCTHRTVIHTRCPPSNLTEDGAHQRG
eukprot:4060797-Pyramimonas_sp.AAC.1